MNTYRITYKTEMGMENEMVTMADDREEAMKRYEEYMELNRAENCEVIKIEKMSY